MPESSDGRRRPTNLSAQTKWEIFLQITAGEITQAEAARKWRVDVSTVIGIRRARRDGPAGNGIGSSTPPAPRSRN